MQISGKASGRHSYFYYVVILLVCQDFTVVELRKKALEQLYCFIAGKFEFHGKTICVVRSVFFKFFEVEGVADYSRGLLLNV